MSFIQLEGYAKFGPVGGPLVEYNASVTSLVINRTRNTIDVPATWANATQDSKAGSRMEMLTLNFLSDPTSASSFWAELWDAIDTDDGELDFECNMVDAATSVSNPKFSGTIVVTGVDTGGQAGELRSQSVTFPIKAGTLVKTTTP